MKKVHQRKDNFPQPRLLFKENATFPVLNIYDGTISLRFVCEQNYFLLL
jgi:hypothetical protein